MTFIGYEQGSKGYQFWDKESRSVVISCDVKFDKSKFPNRKDLDYRNPFTDKKGDQLLSRTGEDLPMNLTNLTKIPKWD